jgi:hypothetical protein
MAAMISGGGKFDWMMNQSNFLFPRLPAPEVGGEVSGQKWL